MHSEAYVGFPFMYKQDIACECRLDFLSKACLYYRQYHLHVGNCYIFGLK